MNLHHPGLSGMPADHLICTVVVLHTKTTKTENILGSCVSDNLHATLSFKMFAFLVSN